MAMAEKFGTLTTPLNTFRTNFGTSNLTKNLGKINSFRRWPWQKKMKN